MKCGLFFVLVAKKIKKGEKKNFVWDFFLRFERDSGTLDGVLNFTLYFLMEHAGAGGDEAEERH